MPLPSLPEDIWPRIITLLKPPQLSALSKVNKQLSRITMDPALFRQHLHDQPAHWIEPALEYRRLRALSHIPEDFETEDINTLYVFFCRVQDVLLMVDIKQAKLIVFPGNKDIDMFQLISEQALIFHQGSSYPFRSTKFVLHQLAHDTVILPNGFVAFNAQRPQQLVILNVLTYHLTKHELVVKRNSSRRILDGKSVLVAGDNGEWLMYYCEDGDIILYDWADGKIARVLPQSCLQGSVTYLMSECPKLDGMSAVGLVYEKLHDNEMQTYCCDFDGHKFDPGFLVPDFRCVEVMLRSADKKTFVVLYSAWPSNYRKMVEFVAAREEEGWWSEIEMHSLPQLRYHGREMVMKCPTTLRKCPNFHARFSPEETGMLETSLILRFEDNCEVEGKSTLLLGNNSPIWYRRTLDGLLAVLIVMDVNTSEVPSRIGGFIELVKIMEGEERKEKLVLRRWIIDGLFDACVVADHIIIAISIVGDGKAKLHKLHFDRFCKSSNDDEHCRAIV